MFYTKRKSPHLINLTNLTKKSPSRPIPGFLSFYIPILFSIFSGYFSLILFIYMKKTISLFRLLMVATLLSISGGCSETNDPAPDEGGGVTHL